MLKRFFISLLGTVAGIWLSILLLVIGCIVVVGAILSASSAVTDIKDKSILYLRLEGDIIECTETQNFMDFIRDFKSEGQTLSQMLSAVRLAANDKKIKGIYIDAAGSSMGVASRQELIEALKDFKESGQ